MSLLRNTGLAFVALYAGGRIVLDKVAEYADHRIFPNKRFDIRVALYANGGAANGNKNPEAARRYEDYIRGFVYDQKKRRRLSEKNRKALDVIAAQLGLKNSSF